MKQIKRIHIILVAVLLFGLQSAHAQAIPKKPKMDVEKLNQQRQKIKQEREKNLAKAAEQQSQLKALQPGPLKNTAEQNTAPVPPAVLPADKQPASKPKQE